MYFSPKSGPTYLVWTHMHVVVFYPTLTAGVLKYWPPNLMVSRLTNCIMATGRKLVLHMDIQNTLILTDSRRGITMPQALNTFLAGMVWGEVDPNGKWDLVSDKPSLEPPSSTAVSYYKHLEKQVTLSTDCDNPREVFRHRVQTFTQTAAAAAAGAAGAEGAKFSSYVSEAMKKLEWRNPDSGKEHGHCPKHSVYVEYEGTQYHYIFPSVFKLLQHLEDTGRDYAMVLRTFGDDSLPVLKCLEARIKASESYQFSQQLQNNINLAVGCIKRKHPDQVHLEITRNNFHHRESSTLEQCGVMTRLTDAWSIYQELCSLQGICAVQDDYCYWRDHEYRAAAGKPLWLHLRDSNTHHIMFDDNIRPSQPDSVVDIHLVGDKGQVMVTQGAKDPAGGDTPHRHVPGSLLAEDFKDACIVQVNLLEAICDENYFIDKVAKCEENYDKILCPHRGMQ